MNGAVTERLREGVVDEAVLVDEVQALEARTGHDHLKVIAPAGPVDHFEVGRVRKRLTQEVFEPLAHFDDVSEYGTRLDRYGLVMAARGA